MNRKTHRGIGVNLLSIFLTAASPVIGKLALAKASPDVVALISNAVITLLAWLVMVKKERGFKVEIGKLTFGIGLLNALGMICLFYSLEMIGPVMVGFVGRFIIVFGILFSIFMFKEKCNIVEAFFIVLVLVGGLVFTLPETIGGSLLGVGLALGYAFSFAFSNALMKIAAKNMSAAKILFNYSLVSTLCIGMYAASKDHIQSLEMSKSLVPACLSGMTTFLGMLLYIDGSRLVSYLTLNVMRSLTPFVILLYSSWFFAVNLAQGQLVGGILMTVALMILAFIRSRAA